MSEFLALDRARAKRGGGRPFVGFRAPVDQCGSRLPPYSHSLLLFASSNPFLGPSSKLLAAAVTGLVLVGRELRGGVPPGPLRLFSERPRDGVGRRSGPPHRGTGSPPPILDAAAAAASTYVMVLEERVQELAARVDRMHNGSKQRGLPLPRCDELMRQPDSPFGDGAFLTSHSTSIRWVPRRDGSRQLELQEICRLKRYTSDQADQCLAHQHLSMIGDSLTRYQYTSLAHFLENGDFPARFNGPRDGIRCPYRNETGHGQCSRPPQRPSVCDADEWPSWDEYFAALGGGPHGGAPPMNGRMEAPSVRPDDRTNPLQEADNFLYVNMRSGATLSFLFEAGWGDEPRPLHGFNFTKCSYEGTCRRSEESIEALGRRTMELDFDWSESFPQAIDRDGVVRQILPPPDIAVYNRGHWGPLSASRAQTILPVLHDWVVGGTGNGTYGPNHDEATNLNPTGRCYFKSTTAGYLSLTDETFKRELVHVRPSVYKAGCSYVDYAYLTEAFAALDVDYHTQNKRSTERRAVFVDVLHYQPWVYEELNQVLLNVLCNAREGRDDINETIPSDGSVFDRQ